MTLVNQNVLVKYTLSDELFDKIAPINSKDQLNIPIDMINQFNDGGLPTKFNADWTFEEAKQDISFKYVFLSQLCVAARGQLLNLSYSDLDEFLQGEVVDIDKQFKMKKGDKVLLATNPFSDYNILNQMVISEDLKTFQTFQEYKFILLQNMKPINHTIIAQIDIPLIIGERSLEDILSDKIITDKVKYIKNTFHDNQMSMLELKEAKCVACSDDTNGDRDVTNLDIPVGSTVFIAGVQLSFQNMFNIDLEKKTACVLIKKNNILAFDK